MHSFPKEEFFLIDFSVNSYFEPDKITVETLVNKDLGIERIYFEESGSSPEQFVIDVGNRDIDELSVDLDSDILREIFDMNEEIFFSPMSLEVYMTHLYKKGIIPKGKYVVFYKGY